MIKVEQNLTLSHTRLMKKPSTSRPKSEQVTPSYIRIKKIRCHVSNSLSLQMLHVISSLISQTMEPGTGAKALLRFITGDKIRIPKESPATKSELRRNSDLEEGFRGGKTCETLSLGTLGTANVSRMTTSWMLLRQFRRHVPQSESSNILSYATTTRGRLRRLIPCCGI